MKVLVMGATGGSGRAAVRHLLAEGHEVTAFSRTGQGLSAESRLRVLLGDALSAEDVERAVRDQDAVVVTLGIRENPLRVRLFGAAHTADAVRSAGTRHVIAAMHKHGVRRLVVQTSFGVGETREKLKLVDALFIKLLLKPQIADTELQSAEVSASQLDWVLVQPVHLSDDADDALPFASSVGEQRGRKVSRAAVGRFLAEAVRSAEYVHKSVALSAQL